MKTKVWFITGASRGFGRIWAEAALARGDKVAATARNLDDLSDLIDKFGESVLPLELDVTRRRDVFNSINKTNGHFGQLDVVINNAGYGLVGMIEEVTEQQAREVMEVNFFGALWGTQAALPIMREQGYGHILQTSSEGGVYTFPFFGLYHASKWALEGMTETVAQEVSQFGIHVTLIEPGGYKTNFGGDSLHSTGEIEAYRQVREEVRNFWANYVLGDPKTTAEVILKVVDAKEPPLRIFLGDSSFQRVKQRYKERLKTWEEWEEVSE